MSDDFSMLFERWRTDFEKGRLSAGYEAALFCITNQQPIPTWLVPMVEAALSKDFLASEGRGRGKASAKTESRKAAMRQFIVADVKRLDDVGVNKANAFQAIADDLSKHGDKLWTAEMVKAEYYRNR